MWEQSFPRVGGVVLRVADAAGRGRDDVLIRRADAERLARANEQRLRTTLAELRRLGFDPVLVGTSDEAAIEQALPRVGRPAASDPAAAAVNAVRSAMAVAVAVVGFAAAAPGAARAAPLSVHATTQPSSVGVGDAFTLRRRRPRRRRRWSTQRAVTIVRGRRGRSHRSATRSSRGAPRASASRSGWRASTRACVPARRPAHGDRAAGPSARSTARRREGGGGRSARSPSRSSLVCRRTRCAPDAPPTASRRRSHGRAADRAGSQSPRASRRPCSRSRASCSPRPRRGACDLRAPPRALPRSRSRVRSGSSANRRSRGVPDRRRAADLRAPE